MSSINIQCNTCPKTHQIETNNFEYKVANQSERQMGKEITYEGGSEVLCSCGGNIEVKHCYWEYPEGEKNHEETTVTGGKVI